MTNRETFRQLIHTLCSELAAGGGVFLVNKNVASKAGFPDGTELATPVGRIKLKYTDRPVMGFEVKKVKKAA